MSAAALASLPPVSTNVVNLAIADLAIYAILFPPTVWIAWKHGKAGLVVWQLLIFFFVMRFIADIYQIVKRDEPLIPNAVVIMTNSGSIACLTLTLIGVLYEANIILFSKPRWTEKIILGVTHISNTAGIGLATYGGSPSEKTHGPTNPSLEKSGNCIELFVMFYLIYWCYPTFRRIQQEQPQPNCRPASFLLFAAVGGLPAQLIRIIYGVTYAFNKTASLDPVTGSFATKLFLIFLTQLVVAVCCVAGGWMSMDKNPKGGHGSAEFLELENGNERNSLVREENVYARYAAK